MNKTFSIIFFLAFQLSALAGPKWKVILFNDSLYLELENTRLKLRPIGPKVKFIKSEITKYKFKGNPIHLLHYHAGSAGTSKIFTQQRAILYIPKMRISMGDFPTKIKSGKDQYVTQPIWKWTKSKLTIVDPTVGKPNIINLN
jgi:hypothetical protein